MIKNKIKVEEKTIQNNQDGDENVIKKIRIIKVVRSSGGEGKKTILANQEPWPGDNLTAVQELHCLIDCR